MGGEVINISWEEPFSNTGFPILSYNLTVQNQTSGHSISVDLPMGTQAYHINTSDVRSIICRSLSITLTARNTLGVSDEGIGTFQIDVVVSTIWGE